MIGGGIEVAIFVDERAHARTVAETVAEASLERRESRGAHQRLDFIERDDENFLKHSLCYLQADDRPRVEWSDVTITRSQPGKRDYSGGKE